MTKQEIKNSVFECLSKSDKKLPISEISKLTGHKRDHVYIAVISIKEAKSKNFDGILYWYMNENQKDPEKKIIEKKEPKKDTLLEKLLKENNSKNRKIFLNDEDYRLYQSKKV